MDTILPKAGPVRIGHRTYPGANAVPVTVWGRLLVEIFWARLEAQRGRARLADLNDDQLRDIGVTRQQAQFEADKPFWWYKR